MHKILYMLKQSERAPEPLFLTGQPPSAEITVVLMQDGVTLNSLPTNRVFALADDVMTRNMTTSYPVISYADLLQMIFEADTVIAL